MSDLSVHFADNLNKNNVVLVGVLSTSLVRALLGLT